MTMFAGLDVGGKRTAICVIDEAGRIVWRGMVDTHPDFLDAALARFSGQLSKVGLESGSFAPHLFRVLTDLGYPMVCMDARRAADAIKSRRVKNDQGDAWALAEMLRTGWFASVYVKSEASHRLKALLGAREQLVSEQIGVFIPLIGRLTRPCSSLGPLANLAVLLADARFVLEPNLDRLALWHVGEMRVQRGREVLWNGPPLLPAL